MATIPLEALLAIWERALDEEIGIAIVTNERRLLMNKLYAARQEHGKPDYHKIIIFQPGKPADRELWLVKKETELP